ncbi:MAG TPA: hypothetical protein VEW48_22780 [Thermoanaerobaculia bacterium]|nr:hypothetical protein [Thermoanaerobaculia bacterium]
MAESQGSLLEHVRSGANRQLQILAASGLLPLPPDELIPLQVELARGIDPEIARRAVESLRTVDPRIIAPFLERQAGEEVLTFFAAETEHPLLIETILRRRDVPRPILVDLAGRLPADLQEILILRQDAIIDEPAILDALERNPHLSGYTQRRIGEYREHLLPQGRRPAAAPVLAPELPEEMSDHELAAVVEKVRQEVPAEGEVETKTGLSEGQIRMLPVPARLKLARGASRQLRALLLRDTNPQVALVALLGNPLSEQEVEQAASSRAVPPEVLEAISKKREWISRYNVAKLLVQNGRTPLPVALRLVNRMSVRDLRDIGRDKNVPDAVRSTALRLYRIKQQ